MERGFEVLWEDDYCRGNWIPIRPLAECTVEEVMFMETEYREQVEKMERCRSAERNLESLVTRALHCVVANLDYYARLPVESPFACLPTPLLQRLVTKSPGIWRWAPHLFHLGITECTTSLTFPWQFLRKEDISTFCHALTRCAHNLRVLNYVGDTEPKNIFSRLNDKNPELLCKILPLFRNLEELRAPSSGIKDDALFLIAKHCSKLRVLDVSFTPITFLGFREVCAKCPYLEEIFVNGCNDVDTSEIYFALDTLKNLKVIEHHQVYNALKIFMRARREKFPNTTLQGRVELNNYLSTDLENELKSLSKSCPNMSKLKVCEVQDAILSPYVLYLPDLKSLEIKLLHQVTNENLTSLFSNNLVQLTIAFTGDSLETPIDLTAIGQMCPNLEKLVLSRVSLSEESEHNVEEFHFMKLKEFKFCSIFEGTSLLPHDEVFRQMLCSPVLKEAQVINCSFPPELLFDVVFKMYHNHVVFSSLETFNIDIPDIQSIDELIMLVGFAPKLKQLFVHRLRMQWFGWLSIFVQLHRPELTVKGKHLQ